MTTSFARFAVQITGVFLSMM